MRFVSFLLWSLAPIAADFFATARCNSAFIALIGSAFECCEWLSGTKWQVTLMNAIDWIIKRSNRAEYRRMHTFGI
jgi:hypothetical protein